MRNKIQILSWFYSTNLTCKYRQTCWWIHFTKLRKKELFWWIAYSFWTGVNILHCVFIVHQVFWSPKIKEKLIPLRHFFKSHFRYEMSQPDIYTFCLKKASDWIHRCFLKAPHINMVQKSCGKIKNAKWFQSVLFRTSSRRKEKKINRKLQQDLKLCNRTGNWHRFRKFAGSWFNSCVILIQYWFVWISGTCQSAYWKQSISELMPKTISQLMHINSNAIYL